MTSLIARREFVEFLRDGRLFWAGGVMVLLLLTAVGVGWQRQNGQQAERAAAQALDYDDWIRQDTRHPHEAAHQGMHVFKPPPPLSIIDPGITPYVGSTQWLRAHRESEVKFLPAQDATGLQRFGNLSAAWVMQILGPLLIVVLGFNTFAGEREQGTLRQLMSLGVSSRRLLWGKALALVMGVGVLAIPAAVLAALAVAMQSDPALVADSLLRIGFLGLGYAIYFGIVIFIVLAVSARAPSSRVALISLLALWVVGSLMAPRAISDLSRIWYPSPSRTEFNSALDGDIYQVQQQAWLDNFGVTTGWGPNLPLNKWGIALNVNDRVSYDVLDRHFGALWDNFQQQQRAQEWAGLLVPVLAMRAFSMGISGTDFAGHRDFSVAAEKQRRIMQDLMSEDLVEHADPLGGQHFSYKAGQELWGRVPPFRYETPRLPFALLHNGLSLAILCAGLIGAMTIALVSAPRRLRQ